jgi:hypothetical protein
VFARVDGVGTSVDVTEECYEGRSVGDLLWVPERGIVGVVGIAYGRPVFVDFSDYSLFNSKAYAFEVIRTFNREVSHTRTVITAEGGVVELDVCSANWIFHPSDRVFSREFGNATFLGIDRHGNAYIQSDEMRVAGIQAAKADIKKLRLVRRIGIGAERTIQLSSNLSVRVSLSVYDRVNDFIADDIVKYDRDLYRVLGVDVEGQKIYGELLRGEQKVVVLDGLNMELIYRADILSGKHAEIAEVGSPAFEVSCMVPNDVVRINGKDFVFRGVGRSGPVFIDLSTDECLVTSFSSLVLLESFQVRERTAFIGSVICEE